MRFQFDLGLFFQQEAINAVTDVFEGLADIPQAIGLSGSFLSVVANARTLPDEVLLENIQKVQERNDILKAKSLYGKEPVYDFPNFSIEMETGTGKTYVYLRTIFELYKKYGLKKFVIVVPSVAIREGVLSSLRSMHEHFMGLYENPVYNYFVYSGDRLHNVKAFATSADIQIMIINIQAFQKEENIINKDYDKLTGCKPIELIQATRPVLLIDEPQSVDNTEISKKAIQSLQPVFALRYSATHATKYHSLYKLGPIQAYDMGLVKQVVVDALQADGSVHDTYLRIKSIGYKKGAKTPHATAIIHKNKNGVAKEATITLKQDMNVETKSNRPEYQGYVVTAISAEPGNEYVEFANGKKLEIYEEQGGMQEALLQEQITRTVEEHFKKELDLKDKGIKVLSLFFIDKVASYRKYSEGEAYKGKMALWFEEAYKKCAAKEKYKDLLPYSAEEVHDGYFSSDTKKGVTVLKDSKEGTATKADNTAYELIMRDKERLLSLDEPLRFIFSHSALKEGWDNPNVFQLCSLREMGTERERRQTLGRGLRLPVNQDGLRVTDESINRLTVIANDSFENYARGLQEEIERDTGVIFGRVGKIDFAGIVDEQGKAIGQEESAFVWHALVDAGYLDDNGDMTDECRPRDKDFQLDLPEEFSHLKFEILDVLQKFDFSGRVKRKQDRVKIKYNKQIELSEDFQELWERISKKTRYNIEFSRDKLVELACKKMQDMVPIEAPRIVERKVEMDMTEAGVEEGRTLRSQTKTVHSQAVLPDIVSYLRKETDLTRKSIAEILLGSGRLADFSNNPQVFMKEAANCLKQALGEQIAAGVSYEKIAGQFYEMRLFEDGAGLEAYLNELYKVQSTDNRTPYDYIHYESSVEHAVAKKLDTDENVRFFCKLPGWFTIPTPLGSYNPDWALVVGEEKKLYFVRETKSTHDSDKRRSMENFKVQCGAAHFKALDVNFKVATDIHEVVGE